MKKAGRFLALLLALCLCLPLLCACGERVGAGNVDTRTALKVGGYKVTADEFLYICRKYKAVYEEGDPTAFRADPVRVARWKEAVIRELCAVYAPRSLAEEYDVELTEEDQRRIDEIIRTYIASYPSEQDYLQAAIDAKMT